MSHILSRILLVIALLYSTSVSTSNPIFTKPDLVFHNRTLSHPHIPPQNRLTHTEHLVNYYTLQAVQTIKHKHHILNHYTIPTQQELEHVKNLLEEYDDAFFYQDDARIKRMQNRKRALKNTEKNYSAQSTCNYELTHKAAALLTHRNYDSALFTQCCGTPLQQQVHQELIAILNQTGDLSNSPTTSRYTEFMDAIVDFCSISSEFNRQGEVAKACAVTDLCWALFEGVRDGVRSAIIDIAHHPLETAACIVAGEYVLAYQLLKVTCDVAQIGIAACIDREESSRQWHDYIAPIEQCITAIRNKEISLRDGIRGATQITAHLITQGKLLRGLGTLYTGTKTAALAYAKKHPLATPQQYMATPDGLVFKAVNNSDAFANVNTPTRRPPNASKAIKESKKAKIKRAQLPTKGKLRYVPPKNWYPTEDLPRVRLSNGDRGYLDRFGNIWTRGETRTIGEAIEWDVQLSRQGQQQVGWMTRDNSHLNVSLKGRVTHK